MIPAKKPRTRFSRAWVVHDKEKVYRIISVEGEEYIVPATVRCRTLPDAIDEEQLLQDATWYRTKVETALELLKRKGKGKEFFKCDFCRITSFLLNLGKMDDVAEILERVEIPKEELKKALDRVDNVVLRACIVDKIDKMECERFEI